MLEEDVLLYWNAYAELTSDRPEGFADVKRIPWSVVQRYGEKKGFDEEQQEDLEYYVREMDTVYIAEMKKRQPGGNK